MDSAGVSVCTRQTREFSTLRQGPPALLLKITVRFLDILAKKFSLRTRKKGFRLYIRN